MWVRVSANVVNCVTTTAITPQIWTRNLPDAWRDRFLAAHGAIITGFVGFAGVTWRADANPTSSRLLAIIRHRRTPRLQPSQRTQCCQCWRQFLLEQHAPFFVDGRNPLPSHQPATVAVAIRFNLRHLQAGVCCMDDDVAIGSVRSGWKTSRKNKYDVYRMLSKTRRHCCQSDIANGNGLDAFADVERNSARISAAGRHYTQVNVKVWHIRDISSKKRSGFTQYYPPSTSLSTNRKGNLLLQPKRPVVQEIRLMQGVLRATIVFSVRPSVCLSVTLIQCYETVQQLPNCFGCVRTPQFQFIFWYH